MRARCVSHRALRVFAVAAALDSLRKFDVAGNSGGFLLPRQPHAPLRRPPRGRHSAASSSAGSRAPNPHRAWVTDCCICGSGAYIATATSDRAINVFDCVPSWASARLQRAAVCCREGGKSAPAPSHARAPEDRPVPPVYIIVPIVE